MAGNELGMSPAAIKSPYRDSLASYQKDLSERYPYDGKGAYTAPNGDRFPAKRYDNVLVNVTMWILIMECAERLCYYGLTGSVKTFLLNKPFEYSNSKAAALTNTVTTVVYLTPLVGAYCGDQVLGRYKTILFFGLLYLVGVLVVSITTHPEVLSPVGFFIGLYLLVALGAGGIKPNVVTFGADQFDIKDPQQVHQQQRYFNFFYWFINLGAFVSFSVLAKIACDGMGIVSADYGFFLSFAISAGAWVLAIVIFLIGAPRYICYSASGSAVINFFKSLVKIASAAWQGTVVLVGLILLLVGLLMSTIPPFLSEDKERIVKIINCVSVGCIVVGWISIVILNRKPNYVYKASAILDKASLEDARLFLRVWSPGFFSLFFWVIYNQMTSNMYTVACQMNMYVGGMQMSGTMLNLGDVIAIVVFIPVMDRWVYPYVEKLKGSRFTSLQKMFCGLILACLAMGITAILEIARKNAKVLPELGQSNCAPKDVYMSDISVLWMMLPYALIGVAEVLISVPIYDLSYAEVPAGVRSSAQALMLFCTSLSGGVSAIISLFFSSWMTRDLNQGHMDYLFWFLTGLSAVAVVFFLWVSHDFEYISAPSTEISEAVLVANEKGTSSHVARQEEENEKAGLTRRSFASVGSTKI